MRTLLMLVVPMLLTIFSAVGALAADAPQDRATVMALAKDFIMGSWPILAAWLVSEVMPFLPTKANGIAHLIYTWLKSKGGAVVSLIACLFLAGCTPLISVAINNGGDSSKQSIKGESDQTPSTTTNASVPVAVGATPTASGTVTK